MITDRREISAEEGFSLIEVLVAMLVLAVAIIGTAATLDGTRNLTNAAERQQAAATIAEREMEKIRAVTYSAAALCDPTCTPASTAIGNSANPNSPDRFITGTYTAAGALPTYDWDQSDTVATAEELVINTSSDTTAGTGQVRHKDAWYDDEGNQRGEIYRYITWVNDPCCSPTRDYKRVTVVVTTTLAQPPASFNLNSLVEPRSVVVRSFKTDPGSVLNPAASAGNPCEPEEQIDCHEDD